MESKDHTIKELSRILGSRKTLYDYFKGRQHFLLPDYKIISLDYLYKLMSGEKLALSLSDVKSCLSSDKISLSRERMQKYCLSHEIINKYMPETPVDKDFIIKVIAALDNEYYNKIFEMSKSKYMSKEKNMRRLRQIKVIKLCPEFGRILFLIPNMVKSDEYTIAPTIDEIDNDTFQSPEENLTDDMKRKE
ncbi:unnamed protein product [Blepharisma stoltei]|uniref:Uncharacterized protein n=1 Tax=Blepharisma stoltei TaxID=1481888 RepID=A0AAU9IAY4_9CILI|nr:unnamed protein product [Blepharisma stoltei]